MSKLEKGLTEWVSSGLITSEQAERIREHEAAKPESSWVMSGLLILGAVIISIGVISLIAANWDQIPAAVKLGGDFVILLTLAAATVRAWEKKRPILFETLLLAFMLMCLASIGLISQIYHTGGRLYQALLLWSVITSVAALAAQRKFVPFIWAGAFLTGIVYACFDAVALRAIFQQDAHAIFMAAALLSAVMTLAARRWRGESELFSAFGSWTVLGGGIALAVADFNTSYRSHLTSGLTAYSPAYVLAVFAALGILLNTGYRKAQRLLLLGALGVFLIPFHLRAAEVRESIANAPFTIAFISLMAIYFASLQKRRLFQWLLLIAGARFLVLYFQAFGGLALTGLGLIISGALVIGLAVLWNKYKTKITDWTERRLQ